MNDRQRKMEEYLAEAKKAEDCAAKFPQGSVMRESWLRVAFAFRDMARVNGWVDPSQGASGNT